MKIWVDYDNICYGAETKDTSINVPWHAGLRVFFKILRRHGYIFTKIRPMVEACVKVNDTEFLSKEDENDCR